MKHSGESVSGASAGPWPSPANVPVTVKGDVRYLYALPEFKDAIVVTGVQKPVRVSLLRMDRNILHSFADGKLEIRIPDWARTGLPDVVKVCWK